MCLKIFVIKCEKLKEVKEISKKPLPSLNNSNSEKSFTFDLKSELGAGGHKGCTQGTQKERQGPLRADATVNPAIRKTWSWG